MSKKIKYEEYSKWDKNIAKEPTPLAEPMADELEKLEAFNLIKRKEVDTGYLFFLFANEKVAKKEKLDILELYNKYRKEEKRLTRKEFNFFKRLLK